jgi:cytochrome c-type biogenesis protein CcmE
VNKRARNRLIGVTAILLLAIVAIFATLGQGNRTAYYKSVKEVSSDSSLQGKRVKVGGIVVAGSWDQKSNPMRFTVHDEKDTAGTGATVKVIYNGAVPSTFGDGVTAIVTGSVGKDGSVTADEMITKCPSKYESAKGALPVGDLLGKGKAMEGTTVRTTGYVKAGTVQAPGSGARFVVTNDKTGGKEISVAYEGALPNGMNDGSRVILTGALEADGTFVATGVAMDSSEK